LKKVLSFLLFLFVLPAFLIAGEGKITPRKANELYQQQNYSEALEYYKYLIKADEKNIQYNMRIGVCYLNTYINKSLAIPYLKTVIDLDALDQNVNYAIAYYLLGKAYHYNQQFDEAIKTLEKFLEQENITAEDAEFAKQKIQFCFNAKELVKYPVEVEFQNLGKEINSEYADYYPHVPADESFLIFNSKRDNYADKLYNGSYASNVYVSEVKDGKYKNAKLIGGKINTKYYNEAIIGMSANGRDGIFYIDNEDDLIDLYLGEIKDMSVLNVEILNPKYNSNDLEIAASVSADGQTLYIASKRKGGYGGSDIYRAQKLPTGHWGELENLGPEINTPYDDVFPNISPDEKTLYFSSEGHTSMGGLDIFKAEWDSKQRKWTAIKNIGYPINTPEDNMNFRVSTTGKYGYISAFRPGGYGDLDIYRVDFNEIDPRYTVIAGKIYAVNTNQIFEDVEINVHSNDDDSFFGTYLPNNVSGRYVIILPPGNYTLSLQAEGYQEVSEDFEILDKSDYRTFISQDLVLKPKDILDRLAPMEEDNASLILDN
jgi:tetratricopeptide (TPR) repeat protein